MPLSSMTLFRHQEIPLEKQLNNLSTWHDATHQHSPINKEKKKT